MTTFVALLRGINVGKHRRVAMADVRGATIDAGYDDVTSYLQSGNLILESRGHTSTAVGSALEKVFEKSLQLDIDVIVRSAAELAKVVAKNPLFDAKLDPEVLARRVPEAEADRGRRSHRQGRRVRTRRIRVAGLRAVLPLSRRVGTVEDGGLILREEAGHARDRAELAPS